MPFVSSIINESILDVSYVTKEKLALNHEVKQCRIPTVVFLFNQFNSVYQNKSKSKAQKAYWKT